jgi:hypothetical protein
VRSELKQSSPKAVKSLRTLSPKFKAKLVSHTLILPFGIFERSTKCDEAQYTYSFERRWRITAKVFGSARVTRRQKTQNLLPTKRHIPNSLLAERSGATDPVSELLDYNS